MNRSTNLVIKVPQLVFPIRNPNLKEMERIYLAHDHYHLFKKCQIKRAHLVPDNPCSKIAPREMMAADSKFLKKTFGTG